MGGDGQVTMGDTVVKNSASKIRRLYKNTIVAGFAGATADALHLFDLFEKKLEKHQGQLTRAAVELTKDWRTDRMLRRLEALLAVADKDSMLLLSGDGDVLQPEGDILAIGSGSGYARSAAQALVDNTDFDAATIVKKAMCIASKLCIYTNDQVTMEEIKHA